MIVLRSFPFRGWLMQPECATRRLVSKQLSSLTSFAVHTTKLPQCMRCKALLLFVDQCSVCICVKSTISWVAEDWMHTEKCQSLYALNGVHGPMPKIYGTEFAPKIYGTEFAPFRNADFIDTWQLCTDLFKANSFEHRLAQIKRLQTNFARYKPLSNK